MLQQQVAALNAVATSQASVPQATSPASLMAAQQAMLLQQQQSQASAVDYQQLLLR